MKTTLRVYSNEDDTLLRWSVDALDERCRGFAVERERAVGRRKPQVGWLENYAPPGTADHQDARHRSSAEWPFRCFTWTDHEVGVGDRARYRVVPVLTGAGLRRSMGSRWSPWRTIGDVGSSRCAAHFNRGFVISQFMSRYLDEQYGDLTREEALRRFKADIGGELDHKLRVFLAGRIRTQLLELLDGVRRGKGHVYAALFELGDEELIAALAALGGRAHVVLANGSIQQRKGEPSSEARKRDGNAEARKRLLDAGVDVARDRRFISPGALGHNKFLVVTDARGRAKRVWTGSTNWSTTGLCTQLNNALLVEDAQIADAYLAQWRALEEAGNERPKELAESNATPTEVDGASVHFTRAAKSADLKALAEIVRGAQDGVLFLMFIPGASGTLSEIRKLMDERPELVVRGVVSQLPLGREDEKSGPTTKVRVSLVGAPEEVTRETRTYDVIQPEGNPTPAAHWAAETTRQQFRSNIGYAIVHSKVIVVDPFSANPTVVTGSHNFSPSASGKNDENFIVVRGDRTLAEAYAVNIESAWRHYAGRGRAHSPLRGTAYLASLLETQQREQRLWTV